MREKGGATLYGSLKWHPSSSACSIYSAINQREPRRPATRSQKRTKQVAKSGKEERKENGERKTPESKKKKKKKQERQMQAKARKTSFVRFRLASEMRPIRSSLDDDHDNNGDDVGDGGGDDDVVVVLVIAGPQGSHKICKEAPRQVANALISSWTRLLLMAFNKAVVLDATRSTKIKEWSALVLLSVVVVVVDDGVMETEH